jgi:electron transfer flavoprotein alpha subunit
MILLVAEQKGGKLRKSVPELVSAATELASGLSTEVAGLVLGAEVEGAAKELSGYVDRVYSVSDEALSDFRAEAWATAVTQVAKEQGADVVMLAAARSGLSYSPRVAVRLGAALLEDVIGLEVNSGEVAAKRYSYLSRVLETVQAALPVVISVKPNIFPAAAANASGSVMALSVELAEKDKRVKVGAKSAAAAGRVALEEADIIVTGGRGTGSAEGFGELVEPLAEALSAGIGATRAVVDAGWRPYAEQVGQTGKTVAPNLYIALGVSGAVQHLSGMNRAKVIVAVNRDADAPIFKITDYGIVGDVKAVAPALTEAVGGVKGE